LPRPDVAPVGYCRGRRPTPRQVCQASRCNSYPTFLRLLRRLAVDRASQRVCVHTAGSAAGLPGDADRPDSRFHPVVGYADDAIIVTIALRSVATDGHRQTAAPLARYRGRISRPVSTDGVSLSPRDSCAERGAPNMVAAPAHHSRPHAPTRPAQLSDTTALTGFPTQTHRPISGQLDCRNPFRVPPLISDDATGTQTREYPTTGHAAAASGGWLDASGEVSARRLGR